MSNSTDPFAQSIHGTNPQFLIEKITRQKIYDCQYWKEECFGLTSSTILNKLAELKYIGGTYGGNTKPTKFLCLLLKLLQLQPDKEIIETYINNKDFLYVRLIGAFYYRLTQKDVDIYEVLEKLLADFRPFIYRNRDGSMRKMYTDEFIESLLNDELVCDIKLPFLIKRIRLEEREVLEPRISPLQDELEELEEMEKRIEEQINQDNLYKSEEEENEDLKEEKDKIEEANKNEDGNKEEDGEENDYEEKKDEGEKEERQNRDESRGRDRERRDRRKDDRDDSRDRRNNESRDRRRDDRDDSREKKRRRDDSREDERKRRRDDSRDRARRRDDNRDRERDRDRRRDDSRDRERNRGRRRDESRDRDRGRRRDESRDRERDRRRDDSREKDRTLSNNGSELTLKQQKNTKLFDKMFKSKSSSSSSSSSSKPQGKEIIDKDGNKVLITGPEGSVEYWNQIRAALGMSKLK